MGALLAGLLSLPGCGGGDSGAKDPSGLAPPGTVVFAEIEIRPSGKLKSDVDRLASTIGGIDNLGEFILEKLEEEAREEGEPVDYATDVEPWLGERAGLAFERVEEDGDLSEPVAIVESTDADATQEFVDKQAEESDEPYRDGSYEGVDYKIGGEDEQVIGIVDDFVVLAEDERAFRAAVDASDGDSLADADRYDTAMAEATEGSLADVYIDVGTVLRQSGDQIDEQALPLLRNAGLDPSDASAVASIVPGEDRIDVELSSDLGGQEAPEGDVSELLGSLPADSFAAFGIPGLGEMLQEVIDSVDSSGIPGEVPPNQLKKGLGAAGIDLDRIAGSIGDAGVYAIGRSEASLGGALILATDNPQDAQSSVASIGTLLRSAGTSGVTAVNAAGASGFSVRDEEELGDKPLVVIAKGTRIAIGYGLAQTLRGVSARATLADSAAYREALDALGDTPISGFVDGPAALRLANALVPSTDEDFREARPYLRHIRSIAIGSTRDGDLARATLIISVEE
jgi:hypothetical protein